MRAIGAPGFAGPCVADPNEERWRQAMRNDMVSPQMRNWPQAEERVVSMRSSTPPPNLGTRWELRTPAIASSASMLVPLPNSPFAPPRHAMPHVPIAVPVSPVIAHSAEQSCVPNGGMRAWPGEVSVVEPAVFVGPAASAAATGTVLAHGPLRKASRAPSPSPMRSQASVRLPTGELEQAGGTEGVHLRLEWNRASAAVDQVLRGPADHILNDPGVAQCRLCRSTLTGNIVVDEQVVANHRLVAAMDHAWATTERFHEQRGDIRHRAYQKRKEVEELTRLVDQLRSEFPERVHSYVMRSLAKPRERQNALRKEMDALQSESLSSFPGISPGARGRAPSPAPAVDAPQLRLHPDGEWDHYCHSVKARVAEASPELKMKSFEPIAVRTQSC